MKFSKEYQKYVNFVANKKYLQKGESISGMMDRVGSTIIDKAIKLYGIEDPNVELLKSRLLKILKEFKWVPGGSILSSLGIKSNEVNSLANCTVYFNTSDSYSGISKNEEAIRNLCKRRCGIGQDISHYRPHLAGVRNSAKSSNGLCSRMESMSNVTLEVAQNGRRGALMITCHCKHPDVLDVIKYKGDDLSRCNGANVSIMFTDEFMNQLETKPDSKWIMTFPIEYTPTKDEIYFIESSKEGELVTLPSGNYAKWYPIKTIWDTFIEYNIKGAEPGCIFIDTMRSSASNVYPGGRIASSNPCGELPLPIADSCRLSSINLAEYPDILTGRYDEDIKCMLFASDVIIDIDLDYTNNILAKLHEENVDGMLDDEIHMWELFATNNINFRRNGFGFTGLADWLVSNGIKYGSKESIELTDKLSSYLSTIVNNYSVELAKKYGPFKLWNYDLEKSVPYIKDNFSNIKDYPKYGRRWVTSLTVAPNGTLSILTGTSSGVEPLFAKEYIRKVLGEVIKITHPRITEDNSTLYIEAKDIDYLAKVKLISVIQKYWDNSISTTYNLPAGIDKDTVSDLYIHSWKLGNKGMTIYVDGSRDAVLFDVNSSQIKNESPEMIFDRPEYLECDVHHMKFKDENWIAFVGLKDGKLWEIFLGKEDEDRFLPKSVTKGWLRKVKQNKNTSRYDFRFKDKYGYYNYLGGINHIFDKELWNYGRFVSALMRVSTPVQLYHIINKLYEDNDNIFSWKSNLLRVIKSYIPEETKLIEKCDVCGGNLVKRDGCLTCESCGIQKCS